MSRITKGQTLYAAFAILIVTICILTFFFHQWRAEVEAHNAALDYLQKAEELDHRLNKSVLEAHSFLLNDYDSIVETVTESRSLCSDLSNSPLMSLATTGSETDRALQTYCALTKDRLEAVERFKSENSVLRNSLRYFPRLVENFPTLRQKTEGLDLFSDVLQYCLQPNEEMEAHMRKQLQGLLASRSMRFENLNKHAIVIIETAKRRREIERTIYSKEVEDAIERLRKAYVKIFNLHASRSKTARLSVVGLSGGLALLLLILFHRLQIARDELSDLNSNLESIVRTRTHELSAALKQLEQQQQILAHSTKMSALGEMAGGIAHEINTPLAAISLNAEFLGMDPRIADDPHLNDRIVTITKIVERISKIVIGLRKFSRNNEEEATRPTTLRQVIDDTLILCTEKFKNHGVQLRIDAPHEIEVNCVPEQISQVLLNLLNNAFDAVSDTPDRWVALKATQDETHVVMRIIDSGTGIPLHVVEKLMQPFFTTKEVGKGTGIGLSISKGIIESHHGTLEYVRNETHTTFEIKLPRVTANAQGQAETLGYARGA